MSHNKGTSDCVAQGTLGFIMVSKDTVFPLKPQAGLTASTGYKQFLCSFLLFFLALMTWGRQERTQTDRHPSHSLKTGQGMNG